MMASQAGTVLSMQDYRERRRPRILRIAPELDGLEMLYSNDSAREQSFSLRILFWGLREDGQTVGMVPWLRTLIECPSLCDPLNGHFVGYHDPGIDRVFHEAPPHKVAELQSAAEYFRYDRQTDGAIIQELPDLLGTHAALTHDRFRSFLLCEVISWRLLADGQVQGMLIDPSRLKSTPVLPGDACLYPAASNPDFRYYFQHRVANKIKQRDPDTMAAIYTLIE